MTWISFQTSDSTRDTESLDDIPREAQTDPVARKGDSITLESGGDRLKITVLEVLDPVEQKREGPYDMLRLKTNGAPDWWGRRRYIAVKVKIRNLEEEGDFGLLHVCAGRVIDAAGHEYGWNGASIPGCDLASVPGRGKPSKIGCCVFAIPVDAEIVRFQFAPDQGAHKAGEWLLTSEEQ